jgi:arabinofuranosyltransferase
MLIAGGDHFEYRTLSFWVPLIALGFLDGALILTGRPVRAAGIGLLFCGVSAIIPWTIYARTATSSEWPPDPPVEPIASHIPAPLRPIGQAFDALQTWLVQRGIGTRHQEHRAFWWRLGSELPSRDTGMRVCSASQRPVAALPNVGMAGWVLATCDVIDLRGLSDYVIARSAPPTAARRYLGHERRAPPGYMERFRPNVVVNDKRIFVRPRIEPLVDAEIRAAEATYRQRLAQ